MDLLTCFHKHIIEVTSYKVIKYSIVVGADVQEYMRDMKETKQNSSKY